jgi:hypothetical protein
MPSPLKGAGHLYFSKICCVVASTAITAKSTRMHIITGMTGPAVAGKACLIFHIRVMTGVALYFFMSAIKFKFCLRVVIEQPGTPAVWVMAGLTLVTKATIVLILSLVAFHAIERCCLIVLAKMTVLTGSHGMHSD